MWRSLVARSVRVGEVPSSNLGTPIGAWGNPWFPHEPRSGGQEALDCVKARLRALADHEMATVRHRPQRGSQAPRVVERVRERKLGIARAPEDEARALELAQVFPRVIADKRSDRARGVCVKRWSGEEARGGARRESSRI